MEFVEHTKSAEYCPTYPLLWKTGLFKMFLMLFHNRSKQVNVKSLALFWIIIHQTKRLKWDVFGDFFLPLLKTNMFGSETDDTQGPRHSFMFLRQHDGLMFRLLHLSQTPKTGGLGGTSLSSDSVFLSPTSIPSLWRRCQWARGKMQGSIVSFADVCLGQDPLWFLEFFSFLCQSKQPTQRKLMTFLALSDRCEV